jgi:hypothetical protein|tara:strand:- start:2758 stop:5334 length:2577 start_codon:yes stop_codon:yes gene_type:complete
MTLQAQNLAQRAVAAGRQVQDYVENNVKDSNIVNSARITVDAIRDSIDGSLSEATGAVADPVTEVATRAAEITSSPSSLLGAISSLFGFGAKKSNDLKDFASYSYVFTLGVLTNFEINFPDLTYRRRDPWITILKSGGGLGNSKATTIYESQGRLEYFIDDVNIDSLIGLNQATKQSNATNIEFKVTEPYSMGLFLQTIQVAAAKAGHKNYLEAPFVLSVEFKGWDDNGNAISKPNLRRIFPLKFSNVDFSVNEGGSVYNVAAVPWHEQALNDQVQSIKSDVNLTGTTVSDLLQSGGSSLAENLNTREQKRKQDNQVVTPDEYVILFPKNRSSLDEALLGSPADTAGATEEQGEERELSEDEKLRIYESITGLENSTLPADFDTELSKLLGVIVNRSNIGEAIREFAENPENINEIGQAKLVDSFLDGGKKPFGRPAFVEETRLAGGPPNKNVQVGTGIFTRGNITISDNGRTLTFKTGTKFQDIIEEIVLLSEYGRKIVDAEPDENGMIPWFKIEADVYNVTDHDTMDQTGKFPHIYVYRVVPYLAHISRVSSTSQASPGIIALKRQAAKTYDYIYTGQNDDILDFNIEFDAAFFQAITPFGGKDTTGNKKQKEDSPGPSPGHPEYKPKPGDTTGGVNANATTVETPRPGSGQSGGGLVSNSKTAIARNFNDALVNSPVDLVSVELTIWGDPYYITDSGMGNYTASPTNFINITADGTMDYQSSEVDIELNFRTPLDYQVNGSYMTFPGSGSKPVGAFSGLYQVISCMNSFSGGTFTQQLSLIRRRNQPGLDTNALPVSTGNQIVEEAVEDTTTTTTGGTSAGGSDTGNVGNTEDNLLMNQNQEEREFDIELNEGVT